MTYDSTLTTIETFCNVDRPDAVRDLQEGGSGCTILSDELT
jgi:hypothetical protein